MEFPDDFDDSDDNVASSDPSSSEDEGPQFPELISDGKRMRTVWRTSDGDGDPNPDLVERNMYLLRGHPTWRIFMSDFPLPVMRGRGEEPPKYVYLDDKACHMIFYSEAYSKDEMREFWPWDFNHQGHIKQGRLNRGRPAYLDDSNTTFATGPLRGKDKLYVFSGAPEETEYQPLRPVQPKKDKKKQDDNAGQGAENEVDDPKGAPLTSKPPSKLPSTAGKAPMTPEKGLRSLQSTPARSFAASPRSNYEMSPAMSPALPSTKCALGRAQGSVPSTLLASASPAKRKLPTLSNQDSLTKRVQK